MKTFVISGAGSGIGRAIAQSLSQLDGGSRCVLIGRRAEMLEETKKSLTAAGNHIVLPVDVTSRKKLSQALHGIELPSLNVSGVVANAGKGGDNHYTAENIADDQWQEIIDVNLTGSYNLVNECLPALRENRDGYKNVLLISSILSRMGVPFHSAYCASKAGLLGLMRSWSSQWAREKILVNAICPGWVETEMAQQGLQRLAKHEKKNFEEVYKREMSFVPTGKMSQPEELGNLTSFLFSDQQTSITGQELHVNNGAWG